MKPLARCGALIVLACFVLVTSPLLVAELDVPRFFIDTTVEWQSLAGDSPRIFETAVEPIYGPSSLLGVFDGGKMALLSGYFEYEPRKKAFRFTPGEGFSVYFGKWEKTEGNHVQVEYKFALGEKLACPVGSKSYEDCYGFRYKQPATVATWAVTTDRKGQFTAIEVASGHDIAHRKYISLWRLENREEVMHILKFAEKTLSEHANS